jgi:VCBS repeat-containing protein
MKKKRTKAFLGRSSTVLTYPGNTWLYKCLVIFLIAACLATSAWFFTGTGHIARAATNLTLTAYDIAPRTSYAAGEITFSYTINNPGSTAQTVTLGATIGQSGGQWLNDSGSHVTTVSIAPGTATYRRGFRIRDDANQGAYNVHWAIWINGVEEIKDIYRTNYLNIVAAPTVTITFDDGYASVYDHALPVLNGYGFDATLFALSGMSVIIDRPLLTVAQLQSLKANGWEIGSHSATHPFLNTLTQEQITAEVVGSRNWLISNGLGPVYTFAYPYGVAGNSGELVAANYKYARGIREGFNNYGYNYDLQCVILKGNANDNTLGQVESIVNQAISQSKWAIVLCHGVTDNQNDSWWLGNGWVTTDVFTQFCEFLKNSGVPVKTFAQIEEGTLPANRVPVAVNDSYSTTLNTALTVAAPGVLGNDTDADGDALTSALVSSPGHGTLSLNANGGFTYTPTTGYVGSDSFTYYATDTKANSNTATVTITVTSVNHAPVANNNSYSVNEDAVLSVAASGVLSNDTDSDGNTLTAALVANVSHGTLTLNSNGSLTYTPAANYNGTDSFTYRANDGIANSNTATVTITVNAVNDAPLAVGDTYNVVTGNVLTVATPGVLGNDADVEGTTLTATRLTNPSHGTLVLNSNGSFTYTPTAGYIGSDSYTYRASDGTANSNTVTVSINVTAAGGTTSTFGLNSGSNQWYEGSGVLCSQRFQNTVGTGTLTKLELYLVHGYSGNIRMGVYADSNGAPGNLLIDAGEVAAADGWVAISGLNVPVTGNAYYWLVFNMSGSNVIGEIGPDPGPENSSIWMDRAYGAFTSTFPAFPDWGYGISHWPYVMRATVTR